MCIKCSEVMIQQIQRHDKAISYVTTLNTVILPQTVTSTCPAPTPSNPLQEHDYLPMCTATLAEVCQ
jgi:hypothetical protein